MRIRTPGRSRYNGSTVTRLAPVLFAAPLLVLTACDYYCTTELRAAVHGTIAYPDGTPAVPDSVVAARDNRVEDCYLSGSEYSCFERGEGTYTVQVFLGSQRWAWEIEVDDDDGCHVVTEEVDLVLGTP